MTRKERDRQRYIVKSDEIKARSKAWKEANPERARETRRQYVQERKEEIAEKRREYYVAHRDRENGQSLKWKKENPEKAKEHGRRYAQKHQGERVGYNRQYYKDNCEERKAKIREWQKKNPEKFKAYLRTRKARIRGAEVCDFTAEQWDEILAKSDYRCAYCGRRFSKECRPTQDHVIPLSKGGHHTASNIVPACLSCNCRKGAKIISA